MAKITKDMIETLEEACIVHGLDADVLAKKLNDFVVSVDGE